MNAAACDLRVRLLGELPYVPVWQAMQQFTRERDASVVDELWFLQHGPVFTQGQAGKPEHLLMPGAIPVVPVDRGGQVTYHGPGQLVCYLLLDIGRRQMGARALVTAIEQALVVLLGELGIAAEARSDAPGVYTDGRKIASLGLRIRRGCSFHGLALNVDMDLEPFQRINPCGYAGLAMTQVKDFCPGVVLAEVRQRLLDTLVRHLGYTSVEVTEALPEGVQ